MSHPSSSFHCRPLPSAAFRTLHPPHKQHRIPPYLFTISYIGVIVEFIPRATPLRQHHPCGIGKKGDEHLFAGAACHRATVTSEDRFKRLVIEPLYEVPKHGEEGGGRNIRGDRAGDEISDSAGDKKMRR